MSVIEPYGYTPNLSLPYPELTDTADVPRDIKALADKLDALLGGGSGGGGTSTLPLSNAPVLDVGLPNQIRAGRQLSGADFTGLGLSAPIGLWNLSDLSNVGSDGRPLVNLGGVTFNTGINGIASTAAQFTGSTGQALYLVDSGSADPYRIRTGSWGCWFRTAKRGTLQAALGKFPAPGQRVFLAAIESTNVASAYVSLDGTSTISVIGISDVADDRWHFTVCTHDGMALRLYVDGTLEATVAAAGPLFTGSGPLNIGASAADASTAAVNPNFGRVDEAFVTADVLTDDQVRLLYCCRLAHTLGTIPTGTRLKVHRRRRGAAFAVADFPMQPIRLHNFTGGALTDQGSGGVPLANAGTAPIGIGGVDGTPGNAFSFGAVAGAHFVATDTGLPGGLTTRSYGCWVKFTNVAAAQNAMAWGTVTTADSRLAIAVNTGVIQATNAADVINGPFVADGHWHFVVVTEDNTAADGVRRKLYVDGRLVGGSTVMNAITLTGGASFRIGAASNGVSPFVGQLDGVFVCGYALTTAQVIGLYVRGAQDLGGSPKNAGDHVERVDATSVLWVGDTLEPQHTIDLGVVA